MATTVTPISLVVLPLRTIARARIGQLNYQVLSFLGNVSSVHENMMLPNLDTFVLLAIEGPSTDKKDDHWSMIKCGDECACEENKNGGSSGDFRTLKPPWRHTRRWTKYTRWPFINFVPSLLLVLRHLILGQAHVIYF